MLRVQAQCPDPRRRASSCATASWGPWRASCPPPCAHGDPAVLPLFPWALGKGCCRGLPPPGARPWVEGNRASSFEPGSFWGADEIKWVTPPGPTASWLGFPQAAGCRGPEVTRALGSAQETHLITNLLPG